MSHQFILLTHHAEVDDTVAAHGELLAYLVPSKQVADKPCLASESELREFLASHEVNSVLVAEEATDLLMTYGKLLNSTGLTLIQLTQGGRKLISNPPRPHILLVFKRAIDVVLALIGLLIVALTSVIIYPIVQKQSPGPLIFSQKRVGKQGRIFDIYKFRSMTVGADSQKEQLLGQNEHHSDLMFKIEEDPRIFPFGQKMRQWSIDELPQFINVLKGDMSVVGTRPPTIDEYQKYDFHHFKRLAMKPGITGMWQVNGRSNIKDFEKVVELDADYIDRWSLWLDVKILLKTIKVVLLKEGSR